MKKFIFTILIILFFSISNTKYVESSDNKITVIYNSKDPILPDLPKNCCNYYDVHKFKDKGLKSKTVILSGHGEPPVYVGLNAKEISKIISSFEPELIVLNTCFGASSPILEELSKENGGVLVVAPPYRIYSPGYIFWNDFFNEKLNVYERAKNIVTKPYYNQLVWKINKKELKLAKNKVLKMSKSELKKNYHRRVPPLVRVKFSENNKENNEILILLKPEEIKNIKYGNFN